MSSSEMLYVRASHVLLTGFCFYKLANIYTLLERLKMILHKLVTIGLSSCEISARDYSHSGLSFMIGTPRKQPAPTDGRLFLVKAL